VQENNIFRLVASEARKIAIGAGPECSVSILEKMGTELVGIHGTGPERQDHIKGHASSAGGLAGKRQWPP
jgi:hypothetical protein